MNEYNGYYRVGDKVLYRYLKEKKTGTIEAITPAMIFQVKINGEWIHIYNVIERLEAKG